MRNFLKIAPSLGIGFLAISLLWVVYNSYIPLMLKAFGISSFLVGLIMTLDNFLAISWGPLVGSLSDRTSTSLGKRLPYLIVALPLTAILFATIPYFSSKSIFVFTLLLFFLNICITTTRTPVIALVPDLIPPEDRSKVIGFTNFMGGIGAMIGFLIFPVLYGLRKDLPFLLTSLVVVFAGVVIVVGIKEKPQIIIRKDEQSFLLDTYIFLRDVLNLTNRQLSYLFLSIFTYFLGFNAIETFFTSYGRFELGLEAHEAALLLGMFAVSFFLFSIPAGFFGSYVGNKKAMLIGLTLLSVNMLFLYVLTLMKLETDKLLILLKVLLILGGVFWSLVNVNAFPLVVSLVSSQKVGLTAGYYYFFSMFAAIISPPLTGLIIDLTSHSIIFLWASLTILGGLLILLKVQTD